MITLMQICICVLVAALAAIMMELVDITLLCAPIEEERSTPIYFVKRLEFKRGNINGSI